MGDINSSHCYDLCEVEFACCDGSGGVSLTNITTINGAPPEGGFPTSPGAPFNSVQFNNNGVFGGSANLTWDNTNGVLQIMGAVGINYAPAFSLDVNGQVNSTGCYLIDAVPFACSNGAGGINLTNITNINGQPPGTGTGELTPPAGIDRDIQFNDNGAFGASNTFVYTAAGNLGVGVNNPEVSIQTPGGILTTGVPTTWPDVGPGLMFFSDPVDGGAIYSYNFGPNTAQDLSIYARTFYVNAATSDISGRVGIGKAPGANFALDVNGNITTNHCYYILDIPWACLDSAGTGIDLTNINNINGSPYPPPGGGGSTVVVSDTPPANPSQGNLWFDSGDTQLYIWYQDPNSGQWVPTINQCSGGGTSQPTPPAPPNMSVQWNNNGVFGGSANLIWDNANARLGVNTSTPQFPVDVYGTDYIIRAYNPNDSFAGIVIDHIETGGGESVVSFRKAGTEAAVIEYDSDEDALIFWTGGNDAGLSTLCCDTNSRVGIRTTSPVSALQVLNLDESSLVTFGNDAGPNSIDFLAITDPNNGYNDISCNLYYDGTSWHLRDSTHDGWLLGITVTSSVAGGSFTLAHSPSGSVNLINLLSVRSNGNVGIGTVTPQFPLDIFNPGSTPSTQYGVLRVECVAAGAGAGPYIQFSDGASADMARVGAADYNGFGGSLQFYTKPSDSVGTSSSVERMRIDSVGNVGIGTNSPTRTLDINGDMNVQTYIYVQAGITCGGAGPAGVGTVNVSGGYFLNGAPHMFITQEMWIALTTRIQTLEARLAS